MDDSPRATVRHEFGVPRYVWIALTVFLASATIVCWLLADRLVRSVTSVPLP